MIHSNCEVGPPGSAGVIWSKLCRCLAAVVLLALAAVGSPAQTSERVALVIGNSAYPKKPLLNPRNDAKAMSELLRQAGFAVDLHLDTTQSQLTQAVAQFGEAIRNPKVKFGLFYYAGHGLQQDWRNYLVPVSADIASAEDVRKKTVDVSALLSYMDRAKGRSFLVILDACRDDPFPGRYRPPAKGLSQYDAPAGSLLAYATAPGKVADDGDGANGLYTSNLLREFSVRGVRVEDAFKRVRLSVRIASDGKQVPWESTSLEDDLYIFPTRRRSLSDEEQIQQLDQEINSWARVKSSNDHKLLASFISEYPSGSISELAQARLNRLLAARARDEALRNREVVQVAEARQQTQERIEQARLEAERAEAQRVVAEFEEQARRQRAELEAARQEALRIEAAREAQKQMQAAQLAQAQLQQAQAQAQRLQLEREAAVRAEEQRQLLAQQEQAARESQLQAQAAAAQAERLRREREASAQAEAQRAQEAQVALERLAAQKQEAAARLQLETVAAAQLGAQGPVVETVIAPTPYYNGYVEHQRQYAPGDRFDYRVIDAFTKAAKPLSLRVTAVDSNADKVEYNNGEYVSDLMGNIVTNPVGGFSTPRQFYPAELYVGKKWHTMFRQSRPGGIVYTFRYDLKVVGRERITVPAGTFDTFKIEARGFNMNLNARLERNIWVAPGVSGDIAHETLVRLRNGSIEQNDRQELVSLHQASITDRR